MSRILFIFFLLLAATVCGQTQAQPRTLRLEFIAYDTQSDGSYRLQVNGTEVRVPSIYYPEQNHTIPGTHYIVIEFQRKDHFTGKRPGGKRTDLSELELIHGKTGRAVNLVLGQAVDIYSPDQPAEHYGQPGRIYGLLSLPPTVSLSGDVLRPQRLPWTEGMTLLAAISEAGGLTESGNGKIDLVRKGKPIRFSIQQLKSKKAADPVLKPYDHIIVRS